MQATFSTLVAVAVATASTTLLAPSDGQLWNETKDGVYDSTVEGVAGRAPSKEAIEVSLSLARPDHGHLAAGYASTESASMSFSWSTTENYGCPAMVNVSSIEGLAVASFGRADAVSKTYEVHSDEVFAFKPINHTITYVSPFMHQVTVDGLEPNVEYSYRLGSSCEPDSVWSERQTFWSGFFTG